MEITNTEIKSENITLAFLMLFCECEVRRTEHREEVILIFGKGLQEKTEVEWRIGNFLTDYNLSNQSEGSRQKITEILKNKHYCSENDIIPTTKHTMQTQGVKK